MLYQNILYSTTTEQESGKGQLSLLHTHVSVAPNNISISMHFCFYFFASFVLQHNFSFSYECNINKKCPLVVCVGVFGWTPCLSLALTC